MAVLDLDIVYEVVDHINLIPRRERKEILSNLSSTCKELNNAVRPILFHDVRWPHRHLSKINGCEDPFLPDAVLPHICELCLQWPEDWPDTSPQFLEYAYHQMLEKLRIALPRMSSLRVFQMTWPLTPPSSLLSSLAQCHSLKDVRIIDTPLVDLFQVPDFSRIERMTLVPVAEAMRTGEGPFNNKFRELQYFARPYRQRHRQKPNVVAAQQYVFETRLAKNVRYLQISTQYLQSLASLASPLWPELQTLVLTGGLTPAMDLASIVQVVVQMPKLYDLRLLLAKRLSGDITFACPTPPFPPSHTDALSRIKHLSLSNSYELSGLLKLTSTLERLSITAISRHPQIPIALTTTELMRALQCLEVCGGNSTLRKLRVMTEDNLTVELFKRLGRICPKLEFVEVELCGYRDGEAGFEWTDYADVFSTYQNLRELRIGIPFMDCEDPCKNHADSMECIRYDRRDCATYFAYRVPTLDLVGFEYWVRTGSHRKEDRWLDYEVVRLRDGGVTLLEIAQTWYPFPEVWKRDFLHDS